jgi:hypothetical protein
LTLLFTPPVRTQLPRILGAVNRRRPVAGLDLAPQHAIWLYRSPVRPFGRSIAQV